MISGSISRAVAIIARAKAPAFPEVRATASADGRVYYSDLTAGRIFTARVRGDSVGAAEDTGITALHSFIAPDESFVLLDAKTEGTERDIFVAFRLPDGAWSELIDLGPGVNTTFSETCPSQSPDGRFLFFSRYDEENEVSNVYWVRSRVVEAARERLVRR